MIVGGISSYEVITGWTQVCCPCGLGEDALQDLEDDLYYSKRQPIFIDLMIILRTITTVCFQKGSRSKAEKT